MHITTRLLPCAVEHLNAEIVQLTVSDIALALEWIKCSYLYIRIKKAWMCTLVYQLSVFLFEMHTLTHEINY
jgi:hypothetical protein